MHQIEFGGTFGGTKKDFLIFRESFFLVQYIHQVLKWL